MQINFLVLCCYFLKGQKQIFKVYEKYFPAGGDTSFSICHCHRCHHRLYHSVARYHGTTAVPFFYDTSTVTFTVLFSTATPQVPRFFGALLVRC